MLPSVALKMSHICRHYLNSAIQLTLCVIVDFCLIFQVGLMRDGRLLAESPPDTLIQSHGMAVSSPHLNCCVQNDTSLLSCLSDAGGCFSQAM